MSVYFSLGTGNYCCDSIENCSEKKDDQTLAFPLLLIQEITTSNSKF